MIMRLMTVCLLTCATAQSASAQAIPAQAIWKFERSADYYGRTPVNQKPKFTTIVIRADKVELSAACVARATQEDYFFSDVFQPMAKEGVSAKQVDNFLTKQFDLSLSATKKVYSLTATPANCAQPMMEFFVVKDKLLVPAGATFYTYVKADADTVQQPAPVAGVTSAVGYKISRLPLDYDRYFSSCRTKILDAKGWPHTSDKCAPDVYPYVADPKSTDPIMRLVGNRDYAKGGEDYASGFSPPFQRNVPATFLVFAPMKQVTLVRVDDFQVVKNEARDTMSGVYLSIVDGKVVDQISGCHFDRDYVCVSEGRKIAKLTDNGKFHPLK
jgi:hypothetical protein